ncbi:hypothetical protein D3C87_1845610 [compost metagenome]
MQRHVVAHRLDGHGILVDQEDTESARRRPDRSLEPSRSPADDEHICFLVDDQRLARD